MFGINGENSNIKFTALLRERVFKSFFIKKCKIPILLNTRITSFYLVSHNLRILPHMCVSVLISSIIRINFCYTIIRYISHRRAPIFKH